MEDARSYMINTDPAIEGLFNLLNKYGWQKMRGLVSIINSKNLDENKQAQNEFSSTDMARDVIAGSILQIAYVGIDKFAIFQGKSKNTLHFESEINRLITENPTTRYTKKEPFTLPESFCVGRDIGHVPLGMIIYAGRNQYNHYNDKRLGVTNELIFNHLHSISTSKSKKISFDIYKEKHPRSYSILAALGWIDSSKELGYAAYKRDLCDVLQVQI